MKINRLYKIFIPAGCICFAIVEWEHSKHLDIEKHFHSETYHMDAIQKPSLVISGSTVVVSGTSTSIK